MTVADTPDVCIVGTGPAGALVGATLAEAGHEVVFLEAGERFDLGENDRRMEESLRATPSTDIWEMGGERDAYSTSGPASYRLNKRRVKGVGGSTLHWGGTVPRMHPEDFATESLHGFSDDWPITYGDLEPYYLQAEHELGAAGAPNPFGGGRSGPFPMDAHPFSYSDRVFEEACDALGITLHHLPRAINSRDYDGRSICQGWGTCSPACPSGAKYSADVHVRKAEAAGAEVIDRAPVQRLTHDEDGRRIEEAIYIRDGEIERLAADSFVVACGAIETPRLLLLSESDTHQDGLANSSGLVGRRFMEHVAIRVRGSLDEPTRQHLIGFGTSQTQQFYPYEAGPTGSILLTPLNDAMASPPQAIGAGGSGIGQLLGGELPGEDLWGESMLETVRERTSGHLAISGGTDMLPDPNNRVTLDESTTDDHGNPVPDLQFGTDDHAHEVLERAEVVMEEIMAETGAADIRTSHPPHDPFFANHQTGTTRMGTDPDESVVDRNLRAHDHENLYISGGSVFVTGGPANPTLTIAALALRLADHLADEMAP